MDSLEKKGMNSSLLNNRKLFYALLILVFIIGSFLTWKTQTNAIETQKQETIMLAKSASSLIPKSYLLTLTASELDLEKEEYKIIKQNLIRFVENNELIHFAYIFMLKDDDIYYAVDSEPENSSDYSPPGEIYYEAEEWDYIPFIQKIPTVSEPFEDSWGKWVSVLVPITDYENNEILGVFGLDYPVSTWYMNTLRNTIQVGIMTLCVLAIIIVLQMIISMNFELKKEKQLIFETDNRLRDSMALYKAVFDQTTIGIAIADNFKYLVETQTGIPSINPAFEKILGRPKEQIADVTWSEITNPNDLGVDLEYFKQFKAGIIEGYEMDKRYIRPDGKEVWVHMIISPLHFENPHNKYHLCIIEDITSRKIIEKNLKESENSKSILLDNLPGMIYRCKFDKDWTMLFTSQGCKELTGYDSDSLINNSEVSYNNIIAPKYRQYIWDKWITVLNKKQKFIYEYEIITADGQTKWVYEQGQGIYDEFDNVVELEGLIIDISDRKNSEDRIRYVNEHDALSGLYNQKSLVEHFNNDIENEENISKAVIIIHIKRYNLMITAYGYSYCESITLDLVNNLSSLTDETHMLYQLSMDRFALYVKNFKNIKELTQVAEKIVNILSYNVALRSYGAWVGLDIYDKSIPDIHTTLKNATMAANFVKGIEPFGYSIYNTQMEESIRRQEDVKDVIASICNDSNREVFHLVYQPILDSKGNICFFEALARIDDDKLGSVSPSEFIPIAEKRHLIVDLGKIILDEACQFIKLLENNGQKDISVSVNISAIQILRDDFLSDLRDIINKNRIPAHMLILEITESVFAENLEFINSQLAKAQVMGIRSAIDDFGTGYSSLSRERELAADIIKIDKFFIDQILVKDEKELITSDIIHLAHKLGQRTVAEGIETNLQKEYLKRNDCDYYQGFLFSKPLSAKDAISYLKKD